LCDIVGVKKQHTPLLLNAGGVCVMQVGAGEEARLYKKMSAQDNLFDASDVAMRTTDGWEKFTRFDHQVDNVVVSQDRHFNALRKVIADLALASKLPLAV
jgi:hypothetical protein